MSALNEWDSFYVIVGSAAGALIGLQFVVMTLVAERPTPGVSQAGRAFGTPTVVHFSACLLLAALVRVPWPDAVYAFWSAEILGICGLAYMALTVWRMWHQQAYQLDWEDRTFHVLLPFAAYGLLALTGASGIAHAVTALFGVGAAALLLLFIGIHNAWDAVAWHVYVQRAKQAEKSQSGPVNPS
jgi:hypothetical protein